MCQFQPKSRTLRRHQTAAAIIAIEMAENKCLVSKLAGASAAQLQCHIAQHSAHMATLWVLCWSAVVGNSYIRGQEVVAILKDVVDDVHERVALLKSSLGHLSQD